MRKDDLTADDFLYIAKERDIWSEVELMEQTIFINGEKSGIKKGHKIGKEEGIEEGKIEGEKIGIEKGKKEMAKMLKESGIDAELIALSSGLSKAEIAQLYRASRTPSPMENFSLLPVKTVDQAFADLLSSFSALDKQDETDKLMRHAGISTTQAGSTALRHIRSTQDVCETLPDTTGIYNPVQLSPNLNGSHLMLGISF